MPRSFAVAVLVLPLLAGPIGSAQTPAPRPAPPTTTAEAHARLWTNSVTRWHALGTKIVTMARQFPQEKADFRFHPDTRTFLEEVWHETFDQQMLEGRLKGPEALKALDQKKLFSGEGRPRELSKAADELEAVLASSLKMLEADSPTAIGVALDFYIEHLGVAYGKLAAMYRANGLVPPVTAEIQKRTQGSGAAPAASATPPAQPRPPATVEGTIVTQWNSVFGRIIAMAKDFPEEKFDYKPHPDVRSFLQEIWHVTATAQWLAEAIKSKEENPKLTAIFSDANRPRGRAELVAQLESAVKECATLLQARPDPRATSVLTHAAEDYGKLVVMYRVNGLVPPATRAAAARRE